MQTHDMLRMKVKTLILWATEVSGILSLVERSAWRQRRLLVVGYHGVSIQDEHEWNPFLYISPERLRQRLEYLHAKRYSILPLAEGLERLRNGSLPPRAVAITFDDGARDFSERSLPLLRAYDVPTTLFLTTYYVDRKLPVFDTALSYLMWKGRRSGAELSDLLDSAQPLPVAGPRDRLGTWQAFQRHAAKSELTAIQKHELLERVANRLGIRFDDFVSSGMLQLMTPAQVRALPRDLIQVELHTHRHRMPPNRELFMCELSENQKRIGVLTGDVSTRKYFCYPNGDYDRRFLAWLSDFGVRSATTGIPGLASTTDHHLLVPRFIDTMAVSRSTFAAWTSGAAALLPRRTKCPLLPVLLSAARHGRL